MIPSSKARVHTIFTVYSLIFGRKTRFSGTVLTLLKSEIVELREHLLSGETALGPAKLCLALGHIYQHCKMWFWRHQCRHSSQEVFPQLALHETVLSCNAPTAKKSRILTQNRLTQGLPCMSDHRLGMWPSQLTQGGAGTAQRPAYTAVTGQR